MFKYLKEHAGDVAAVKLVGQAGRADYESLIPELEEKIRRFGKINLYWEMEFDGWQPLAAWQDLKFDLKHVNDFRRVALVGDRKWEEWLARVIRPFTPAEVRYYDLSQREEALAWVTGKAEVGELGSQGV
jgi:hypothetical protein